MKIELVKQTTEITGRIYYYVKAKDKMMSDTWTDNEEEALKHFARITELAKLYPKTVTETVETVEI